MAMFTLGVSEIRVNSVMEINQINYYQEKLILIKKFKKLAVEELMQLY
jgi:hypothetical protein